MAKKKQQQTDDKKEDKKDDKKPKKNNAAKVRQRRIAVGLFLIFLAFFLLFTYFSFFFSWQTDQSIWSDLSARDEVAENWMSKIGAYLGHILIYKGFRIACIIAF